MSLHSGWIARGAAMSHPLLFCVFVLFSLRVVHLTAQDGISTTIVSLVCRVFLFVLWPLRG